MNVAVGLQYWITNLHFNAFAQMLFISFFSIFYYCQKIYKESYKGISISALQDSSCGEKVNDMYGQIGYTSSPIAPKHMLRKLNRAVAKLLMAVASMLKIL